MSDKYFEKFPLIRYANNTVTNITERAIISKKVFNNPYAYYSYDISNSERPDQIASNYYNDPYRDWIVYLSNNIIDPYYDWYLTDKELNDYMIDKYNVSSINILKNKIAFFRNNWYQANDIDVSTFAALPNSEHKYWEANYNNGPSVVSYSRQKNDWVINTNKSIAIGISSPNANFIKNEVIKLYYKDANNTTANAQVIFSNSSVIVAEHVVGYTNSAISSNSYVFGTESNSNTNIYSVSISASNIPIGEEVYWSPVYIYDYENEKNEEKRTIRLLGNTYSSLISNQLKDIL